MPPKADPYATKSARAFDLLLILFTLLAIAVLILTAPRHQPAARSKAALPATADAPVQLAAN